MAITIFLIFAYQRKPDLLVVGGVCTEIISRSIILSAFNALCLNGELWTYLADLNEQAQSRLELIIEQMKAAEGVTESTKQHDQMAWVGAMNSIRSRAEEIVLREMIYEEDAV